jgi:DNA-directed RNA polymerase subunit RPC12/RpoP
MIHCTRCGTQIRNEDMKVYATEGEEENSIDIDLICPKCGHGMWCRIHQDEVIDSD